jgi:5-formyltetrahydrofolate cyclo-ligase
MNSSQLKRAKRTERQRVLALRDAMDPADRSRRSEAVARRCLELPEVTAASTVMAFWSFGSEVDTGPLLDRVSALGIRIALPRIVEGELEPRCWTPGVTTTTTSFGAREPADGDTVAPDQVDVVITPAVVFDRSGRRIGYGGGFYDRFLPRTRDDCLRAGIAFDVQVIPDGEALPGGAFDLRVDAIVTETETIRCDRSA